ncbi:MAG: O-antigen ligase family protein [Ruminococcus sp.]|nr:O-antigen ligase family protein [Ruminococcus sp.]
MQAEILFFAIVIIWLIFWRNRSETIALFSDPVYAVWFLLSISMFDYTPSVLQYGIRGAAILFGLFIVLRTQELMLPRNLAVVLFFVYILYCGLSTMWSVDALQSAVKAAELLVDVLVVSTAIRTYGVEEAASKLVKITVTVSVLVEVYVIFGFMLMNSTFFKVSKGILGRQLTGVIVSADSLCAMSILLICFYLNAEKSRTKNLILIMAFVELILGQARTSLVSAVIILAIYFFRTKRKYLYISVAAVVLFIAFQNWDTLVAYFIRGTDEVNMQTMSGRTTMWSQARTLIAERPWFGYGFGSGGEIVSSQINMSSLHSGIYETLMGVGLVGFVQIVAIYIITLIYLIRSCIRDGISNSVFEIMFLIDMSIRTYMSTGLGGWQSQHMMIFIVLMFALPWGGVFRSTQNTEILME